MPTAASIQRGAAAALGFRHSQQIEGQGDIFLDAEIGQYMKGLKDEPDRPAPQQGDGVIVQGRQIDALEQHAARVRLDRVRPAS